MNTLLYVILTYCSQNYGTGSSYYSSCVSKITECSRGTYLTLPTEVKLAQCLINEGKK